MNIETGARCSGRRSTQHPLITTKPQPPPEKKQKTARKVRTTFSAFLFSLTVFERTGVFCGNLNNMHARRANVCVLHVVSGLLHSGMIYSCCFFMLICRHSVILLLAFHCLVAFKQWFKSYLRGEGQIDDDQRLHVRHKKRNEKSKWSNYGWKGKEAVWCVRCLWLFMVRPSWVIVVMLANGKLVRRADRKWLCWTFSAHHVARTGTVRSPLSPCCQIVDQIQDPHKAFLNIHIIWKKQNKTKQLFILFFFLRKRNWLADFYSSWLCSLSLSSCPLSLFRAEHMTQIIGPII